MLVATGQGLLGNNMFAYCGNDPVNYTDPSGRFYIDWDLYPNQQAGKTVAEWYMNTDEDDTNDEGELTLDAKIKRTYISIFYNLEFEAGIGCGIGQVQEILDRGVAYTCYFDALSIQYSDGDWDFGQRLVLAVYASEAQPLEFGFGMDSFIKNGKPIEVSSWKWINDTQDTLTLFNYANYAFFAGGNTRIGFDIINFYNEMKAIWG